MRRGPDFIVIGAMKCATSTLHEQLARQAGIVMSSPKEPNFFSDDQQWERGYDWYRSLFAERREGDLCGESSTHYTKLPTYPRTIERMHRCLDEQVRFIYVMRHPVDRFVSHYVHAWSEKRVPRIERAHEQMPELVDYGRYAMQLEAYFDAFGRDRVLPVFFDRLSVNPQAELVRICRFIGYRGEPRWADQLERQNMSTIRLRKTAMLRALMGFPGSRIIRHRFVPRSVRELVKRRWAMSRRPELTPAAQRHLNAVFDEDLAQLGRWLGIELSCENFVDATRDTIPRWVDESRERAA